MERIDQKPIPDALGEVRLFMVGIDSAHFIPHVLKHHFDIGVDRVFYIDNNSKDDSISILQTYENVHIWLQRKKFDQSNHKSGAAWVEVLLKEFGVGNWCLLLDLDELFVYPDYEKVPIRDFVDKQRKQGFEYIGARHIDMYSDKKIKDTEIIGSLLECCPYYDRSEFGCRKRVLGFKSYYKKTPLVLYKPNMVVDTGYHNVFVKHRDSESGSRVVSLRNELHKRSTQTGAILHFKFTCHLLNFIRLYGDNMSDAHVKKALYAGTADTNFYDKDHSVFYNGSSDLKYFEQFTD